MKIGGWVFEIKLVDEAPDGDGNAAGYIRSDRLEIGIKRGMNRDFAASALVHEIVHGIFRFCNFEQDENRVSLIGHTLYQVLKENDFSFIKNGDQKTKRRLFK